KRLAGFTLIELLIAITIMVILLTLSVVALRSTQVSARDEKRKTDIDVIVRHLETFYKSGTDDVSLNDTVTPRLASFALYETKLASSGWMQGDYADYFNRYPSAEVMDTEAEIKTTLRDIDPRVLRAPDVEA